MFKTFISRTQTPLQMYKAWIHPTSLVSATSNSKTIRMRYVTEMEERVIVNADAGQHDLDLSEYAPPQHESVKAQPIHHFQNISQRKFDDAICEILMAPIEKNDVEVKPDGIIYLPEIKYRRILNRAFGPGGWAMMPRGKYEISEGFITQEYALFCLGQYVGQTWGEQPYNEGHSSGRSLATALEGAKSNALMRCCKDIGIASELWDPHFIIKWKEEYTVEVWCSHTQKVKGKRKLVRRKDRAPFTYPWKEEGVASQAAARPAAAQNKTEVRSDLEVPSDDFVPLDIVEPEVATVGNDPFMFDSLVNGGDPDSSSESTSTSTTSAFKIQEKVGFGKHRDTKWADLLSTKEGVNYVNYMLRQKNLQPRLRTTFEQAQKFLQTKRRP